MFKNGSFYEVDCGGVTLGSQSRSSFSMQALKLKVSIIQGIHDVRGRSLSLTGNNRSIIEYGDSDSLPGQDVTQGKPGDSCTYDANLCSRVLGEGCKVGACG